MVLCGALGPDLSPGAPRHFAWQAWHLVTSAFVSRGRRGTQLTSTVVLRARRGTHGTVWRAWSGFVARGAAALCVAGVALGDIRLRFTWQAWHKLTSTVVLRARRGTHGTVWRAWSGFVARGAAALCVAGVAQPDIHLRFTWQAWHKLASTVVLRAHHFVTHPSLTHRHRPSLTDHLSHTIFHTPTLSHAIFHTQLCHTPPFIHHLSHITLSHTIFHTPLCHIPSLTHRFVTHHFVTPHLSYTIFHTSHCHTPSFTHHFVTYHL